MKLGKSLACAFVLCAAAGIGACSQPSGDTASEASTRIADTVANAMNEAREKLRTGDVDLSTGHSGKWTRAAISPQGDLLIDGKPVAITPRQRALLLDYRARLVDVAEQGMQVGTQGVELASHAVGAALSAAFSGKSHEQIHDQVEAEAAGIRSAAAKLCDRLPDMLVAQQKLAAALPAFKPYATMTEADIDRCRREATDKDGVHFSTDL